jgi:hypothetical protein
VPLIDEFHHARQVTGIVLQVAVGGRDEAPACELEAGGKRRRLSEVAAEPDDADPRVARLQIGHQLEARVGAAVVDEEELVGPAPGLEGLGELPVQLGQVQRLVTNGNDDGQIGGHRAAA